MHKIDKLSLSEKVDLYQQITNLPDNDFQIRYYRRNARKGADKELQGFCDAKLAEELKNLIPKANTDPQKAKAQEIVGEILKENKVEIDAQVAKLAEETVKQHYESKVEENTTAVEKESEEVSVSVEEPKTQNNPEAEDKPNTEVKTQGEADNQEELPSDDKAEDKAKKK